MKYTVDVIIPTYKPDEKFEKLMKYLQLQTYPVHKYIIMNTGEEYFPEKDFLLPANAQVHHITKEEFDHGATRNEGASYSDADVMLFMTQDAIPKNRYVIENLLKAFKDPLVAVAYGRQLSYHLDPMVNKYTHVFNYPEESRVKSKEDMKKMGVKTFFCSNVCAAYRRDLWNELGGFLPQAIFNEDMIFASDVIQSGYKIAYQADAEVLHSHNYTALEQFRRNFDLGVSQKLNPQAFISVSSIGEGKKLVVKTFAFLMKRGLFADIWSLIWLSGWKFLGYKLGRNYYRLPMKVVKMCSMNPGYWKKDEKK